MGKQALLVSQKIAPIPSYRYILNLYSLRVQYKTFAFISVHSRLIAVPLTISWCLHIFSIQAFRSRS